MSERVIAGDVTRTLAGGLGPAQPNARVTLRAFVERLRRAARPDDGFAVDLERIQAEQPPAGSVQV